MRRGMLTGPRRVEVLEYRAAALDAGQVRLEVTGCGVCGSEAATFKLLREADVRIGLGHEVSGRVVEIGPEVAGIRLGDHVVAMTTASAGMADEVVVEAEHCVPVPSGVFEPALTEPLACILMSLDLVDQAPGATTVVLGATGLMGELLGRAARRLRNPGALIAVGRRPGALARTHTWADGTFVIPDAPLDDADDVIRDSARDVVTELLRQKLLEVTGKPHADVVYEMTGVESMLVVGGDVAGQTASLGIYGYHQGPRRGERRVPLGDWNGKRLRLVNLHFQEGPKKVRAMAMAMQELASGMADGLEPALQYFALDDLQAAMVAAADPGDDFLKAIVKPRG